MKVHQLGQLLNKRTIKEFDQWLEKWDSVKMDV